MKSHVLRPLFIVLGVVFIILVVREIYVPRDFGVHERGYTYGLYREKNLLDWKSVTVKYQGKESCTPCHQKQVDNIREMPHSVIQCENCHGPRLDHPTDPAKLTVDKTRELCLRCHAKLQYPSSARGALRGIDPATHNPGAECVGCHLPHQPTLKPLKSPTDRSRQAEGYCRPCHHEQVDAINGMPHAIIYCESCHGLAGNHPTNPAKLVIDKTRELCVSCHDNKSNHNVGNACITCHDPHKSSLQFLQFLPPGSEVSK